jgi:hypothetical protein
VEAEELVVPLLLAPNNRVPAWLAREMAARQRKEDPSQPSPLLYISDSMGASCGRGSSILG